MKRTLLFLLCVLMGTQLFSETLFGYLFPTLAYLERTTCYYTEGDEQYRTINRLSFEDNMFEIDGNDYIEYNDFWLREDKKGRILVYSEPAKKDLVLYDFTLEVGDTLTTLNIDMVPMTEGDPILPGVKSVVVDYPIYINGELSCPIDTLIVTDVSMVMMRDSNEYKKWTFSNGMEYMEYIGNLGADFFPIIKNPWEDIPTCCIEERLVCASIYDRLIYQMNDAEMQRLNAECQCTSWASKWCDTWNVLEFDGMAFEQTAQTWQYKLAYDTIIDGKEYQAVTRHWTADEEKTKEYVAAVRFEENKKAFIYYDNAEYLLYDFNSDLIEGDTLEVFAGINNYVHFSTYKCVIKSVEHTEGGITESTYSMDIIDPFTGKVFPSPMVWKEFVGSYNGILHGDLLVPGNSNYHLLCAYKNSSIIYSTEDEVFTDYGCEYNAVGQNPENLFPTLWGLQRTSCTKTIGEDEEGTVHGLRSTLMKVKQDMIIDGKQYVLFGEGHNYDSFLLREKGNKVFVYSSLLRKDLVLYDYTLEVGDSLPALYIDWQYHDAFHQPLPYNGEVVDYNKDYDGTILPADTFIVTNISTITLLDGKEHKKWTFNNGMQYVEGIGSYGTSYAENDFYQLIANVPQYSDADSTFLVCASKNGKLLYQMDDTEMERLGAECLCDVEKKWSDTWCDTWNVMEHDMGMTSDTEKTWRHYLANDTIINGQTYTSVNYYWTLEESKVYKIALVRFTEDQKVYALLGDTEYLVYDFSVQVGDTIETIVGVGYGSMLQQLLVHQIDIDGATNRKTITLYPICRIEDDEYDEDWVYLWDCCPVQWIEGVGSTDGFLMGYPPCGWVGGIGCNLLCAYKDDELKYTGSLYEKYGCEYNATEQKPEDLFPTLWGLQQTICSGYYGEEGDEWASGLTGPSQEITMMDGKPYLQWGSWYLREENDKILVYSEIQKKDLVLYDFTLELGDTLTTLNLVTPEFLEYEGIVGIVDYPLSDYDYTYPIDTLVVTELSKETLLDGKEYTRWKFSDGTVYVEGIGSMSETFFHHIADHLPVPVSYLGSYLVCVSKNNKLLFQMDAAEMERLGAECLCDVETSYKDQWCNQWNVLTFDGWSFDETARTSQYRLGKDTVIGDYTYSKFTSRTSVRFTSDRKVYVYYEGFDDNDPYTPDLPTGEYLAYDFSAQVGDTLEVFSGIGRYSTLHCIVVDVLTNPETNLRTITLMAMCDYGEGDVFEGGEIIWLEGVGSPVHGFLMETPSACGWVGAYTNILLCAYKDDELKYTGDSYDTYGCEYNAGVVSEDHFPMLAGLSRTICKEYYSSDVENNSQNNTYLQEFTTPILGAGHLYLYYENMLIREEDDKILIVSRTLDKLEPKEFVLYDFTLQVGDSLPMLYIDYYDNGSWIPNYELLNVVDYRRDEDGTKHPADILIVTDVSMITLSDGKEYKKWTFNNGMEYVEGIGSFGNDQWSGDFFQLIANKGVPTSLLGEHLVCVSKNNKLLYMMDDAEMERLDTECLCEYNSGPRRDNAKNGKIGGRPTPTQWNMLEVVLQETEVGNTIMSAETFSYTLENDSLVVDDKTYYQLARQSTKDTATTKSFVGALHFGEGEDNRVYFLHNGVEYVLYDFTAEPGDTVEIFAGINNYPHDSVYTHVVTGKDTLENGACRMLLEVVFPEETNATATHAEKVWLAGLGSVDGIVHNAAKRTSNAHAAPSRSASSSEAQTSVMLCAWREDSCLYTTNHPDYNELGCEYNQDPTAVEDIYIPQTTYKKIIRNGQLLIIHEDKTYNVMGIEVK